MDHRFPAIFPLGSKIGLADDGWRRRERAVGSGQLGWIFRLQVGKLGSELSRRGRHWLGCQPEPPPTPVPLGCVQGIVAKRRPTR